MNQKSKIHSLAFLRGIAVLAVCSCHFGKPAAAGNILPELFRWLEQHGQYGVQIFFVISGFVIPYSLYQAKYTLKDYFRFLYKRFLRLHPPYLIALCFTLLLAAMAYRAKQLPNPETQSTILQSIFYLHVPIDNPVFWTLRVEAEYYIFMGVYFVLLQKFPKLAIPLIIPLIWAGQTPIAQHLELLQYLVFFLIGSIGYRIYTAASDPLLNYLTLSALIIYAFLYHEQSPAIVATVTIAIILYFKKTIPKAIEFPGEISYSLYLIHFPIGIKLINLLQRYTGPDYNWLLFIIAMIICILLAWIFWKIIEKPSAILSNKVKYGKSRTTFKNYSLKT